MRNLSLIISILLISLACAKTGEKKPETKESNNTIIIDVRTKAEFDSGHLENAINIPYTEIGEQIKSVTEDTSKNIIVYCRSGRRSGIARKELLKMGYKNVINAGGYKDLLKQHSK